MARVRVRLDRQGAVRKSARCDDLGTDVTQEQLRAVDALGPHVEVVDASLLLDELRHQRRLADAGVTPNEEIPARVDGGEALECVKDERATYEVTRLLLDTNSA